MAVQIFANNVFTTLQGAILAADLTLSVPASDASDFPSPTGGDWFLITVEDNVNLEIMKCTSRTAGALTVVRNQEGTGAYAFPNGSRVDMRLTAGSMSDLLATAAAAAGAPTFATKALAQAYNPAITPDFIEIAGYNAAGDGGAATYRLYGAAAPSHAGKLSIKGGTVWYELTGAFVTPEMFGGAMKDGVVDCTSAYNNVFGFVVATAIRKVLMGAGVYRFASKPNSLTDKIELIGCGMGATELLRDYNEGDTTLGLIDLQYPGSVLQGFKIRGSAATTGGAGISSLATALVGRASLHSIHDVMVTVDGTDNFRNPIYFDGSLKITGAIGARDNFFSNVHVFGAADTSFTLKSCVGCVVKGGGLYSAGGTGTRSGGLLLNGVAGTEGFYVDFDTSVINGKVSLADLRYCTVRAREIVGDIENVSTVLACGVEASHHSGTLQTNWVGGSWSLIAGVKRLFPSNTPLTIASDAIAVTPATVDVVVDTQAAAATDDLATITGGFAGQIITLRTTNSARDVNVKDGTGNILLVADRLLSTTDDTLKLQFDGTNWRELGYAGSPFDMRKGIGAAIQHPGYVVGKWYPPWPTGYGGGLTWATGNIRLMPFFLQYKAEISDLACRVTTLAAAGNVQLAIYASDLTTKRPTGAALAVTASISTAATGIFSADITGANVVLEPGMYWMAANIDASAGGVAAFQTTGTQGNSWMMGSATLANISSSATSDLLCLSVVQAFGTWPNLTAGSFTEDTTFGNALVMFKVSAVFP